MRPTRWKKSIVLGVGAAFVIASCGTSSTKAGSTATTVAAGTATTAGAGAATTAAATSAATQTTADT